jgi:hypothetical protein
VPIFLRKQVEGQLRERVSGGESLHDTITWLAKSGAKVREALEMLEGAGYARVDAERELRNHADWAPLIRLMGGIEGRNLPRPRSD